MNKQFLNQFTKEELIEAILSSMIFNSQVSALIEKRLSLFALKKKEQKEKQLYDEQEKLFKELEEAKQKYYSRLNELIAFYKIPIDENGNFKLGHLVKAISREELEELTKLECSYANLSKKYQKALNDWINFDK